MSTLGAKAEIDGKLGEVAVRAAEQGLLAQGGAGAPFMGMRPRSELGVCNLVRPAVHGRALRLHTEREAGPMSARVAKVEIDGKLGEVAVRAAEQGTPRAGMRPAVRGRALRLHTGREVH